PHMSAARHDPTLADNPATMPTTGTRAEHFLRVHPTPPPSDRLDMLAACVGACYGCAESCTLCADACLGESNVNQLTTCIRRCLDCAAICEATARVVARQTGTKPELQRRQLEACIAICDACAEICGEHAQHHEHC